MDLNLTPEEEKFRDECRAWLAANVPPPFEGKSINEEENAEALLAGDPDEDAAPGRLQLRERRGRVDLHRPGGDLLGRQRPQQADEVEDPLHPPRLPRGSESLELGLHLGEDLGVQELTELGTPEQLGQQTLVEAQGRGTTMTQRTPQEPIR